MTRNDRTVYDPDSVRPGRSDTRVTSEWGDRFAVLDNPQSSP